LSKVAIKGASTGTATFTIESPATNTNRTLVLPDLDGVLGKPLFGTVQALTTNTTLTSSDTNDLITTSDAIVITLPAPATNLVFGIVNSSFVNTVSIKTASPTTKINEFTESTFLSPNQSTIVVCDGTNWKLLGDGNLNIRVRQFSSSGTYEPSPTLAGFLVCATGATGGTRDGNLVVRGGSGGGGYSEKFYTAPFSSSYTVTIGAGGAIAATGGTTTFDTISIPSSVGNTGATATAGAAGTGGDYNATGGSGGASRENQGGGGGGSASRAGNGGNGGEGDSSQSGGGGGGTGGNNATIATNTTPSIGGAAATVEDAGVYALPLSIFNASFTFEAGENGQGIGVRGGFGAGSRQSLTLINGIATSIGSATSGRGSPGNNREAFNGFSGAAGHITILEFFS